MSLGIPSRGYLTPDVGTGGGGGGAGPSGLKILFVLKDTDGVLQSGIDLSAGGVIQISTNGGSFANRVGAAPTSVGKGLYYYIPDLAELSGTDGTLVLSVTKVGYQDPLESQDYGTLTTDAQAAIIAAVVSALGSTEGAISSAQTAILAEANTDETAILSAISSLPTNIDTTLSGTHGSGSWIQPSASDIATGVWDANRSAHTTSSTFGAGVIVDSLVSTAVDAIRDSILLYVHDTGVTVLGLFRRMEALVSGAATGLKSATARFYMKDGTTPATVAVQDISAGTRTAGNTSGSEP